MCKYCALSTQCDDYKLVRERILQEYQLLPEEYHQKFRNLVKQLCQLSVMTIGWSEKGFASLSRFLGP